MALVKAHSLQGGIDIPMAYWMIDGVKLQRLASVVSFQLVIWKDTEMRESYRKAQDDFTKKTAAFAATKAELDDIVEKKWPPELVTQHNMNAVAAQAAGAAAGRIQPIGGTQDFTIGCDQSATVLTGGAVDVGKCYLWLKTQPDFKDAQDA